MSLSLENGRQKLSFIRLHLADEHLLSMAVISDYVALAAKVPDLKLMIVSNDAETLQGLLKSAPASVRKRIRVVTTEEPLEI